MPAADSAVTTDDIYACIVSADACRQSSQRKRMHRLLFALLLALLLHLLLLMEVANPIEKHDAPLPHRVSLLEVELVSAAHASEMVKPDPPAVINTAQPTVVPQPEPTVAPEEPRPVIEQPAPIKPVVHKKRQPVKHQRITKAVNAPVSHTTPVPASIRPPAPVKPAFSGEQSMQHVQQQATLPSVTIQQLRQRYIGRIMQIIKAHKRYPYAARRRHMQDDVRVSFSITADGHVSNIQIHGAHELLERSTRAAIAESLPFPAIPEALDRPAQITFTMQYRLNR